jgi:hypothetical protein
LASENKNNHITQKAIKLYVVYVYNYFDKKSVRQPEKGNVLFVYDNQTSKHTTASYPIKV